MVCAGWRREAQLAPGSAVATGEAQVATGERRLFCIGIERILYASVYVVEEGGGGSEELYGALEQVGRGDEIIGRRIAYTVPL